ncbi:MAG: protoporphyrinogen oxidase [Simkania sp.]|nr:protoporphyrinogen oxidase [Simkania sp.]
MDCLKAIMKKQRVIILGAGISGLSAAFALRNTHEVIVLEQSSKVGGWLETIDQQGFLFETGPRTFRYGSSLDLLSLVKELGLEKELIFSREEAKQRFLFFQGCLEQVPTRLVSMIRSPLMKGVWGSLLTEWNRAQCLEDETLWQFAERRFGRSIAERFFDPLSIGIYAVSSEQISAKACFPRLKEMERTHGSITKALIRTLGRKQKKHASSPGLFSFRSGVQTLVTALAHALHGNLYLGHTVQSIFQDKQGVRVTTSLGVFEGDYLISALPPAVMGQLLIESNPKIANSLRNIPMTSLTMVQLGYQGDLLRQKGFGLLVPSIEKQPLLGVVFDSSIFAEHNRGEQTRLTVMLPPTEEAIPLATQWVQQHLGITRSPDLITMRQCAKAIPLLQVGHQERMAKVFEIMKHETPNMFLVGNYIQGASVNDCIASSMKVVRLLNI